MDGPYAARGQEVRSGDVHGWTGRKPFHTLSTFPPSMAVICREMNRRRAKQKTGNAKVQAALLFETQLEQENCSMDIWAQLLGVVMGIVLVIFMWPSAKAAMQRSREVENPDWMGALVPIAIVVVFVIVLIALARG